MFSFNIMLSHVLDLSAKNGCTDPEPFSVGNTFSVYIFKAIGFCFLQNVRANVTLLFTV